MIVSKIKDGKTYLGIELGSTRIKAVLIDDNFTPIANGFYEWENRLENGYWTYSLDDVHSGLKGCYASLAKDVFDKYGITLTTVGGMGISAMMHGYLAFDSSDNLLAPFRTWRNTTTKKAADELTELFDFNIPLRWSISHLYQAVLDNEPHVPQISNITTLAGYVHYLLTSNRVVGVGEASGMFPIDGGNYDKVMLDKFDNLIAQKNYKWNIYSVLPRVLTSGENAGYLTEEGAKFLDPTGNLKAGIPLCPPEGDAGTGMVATNSVLPKMGNVSAGTSIFSMLVLEKPLKKVRKEIDIVTTPDGYPVAMVHCNNCCTEIDSWVEMFGEFAKLAGTTLSKSQLYELLYKNSLNAAKNCNSVTAYNYISGEPISRIDNGRPMCFRTEGIKMSLADFMRAQLYSTLAALKLGMDILYKEENVVSEGFQAHGGLFKVKDVAQQYLADALNTPVSITEAAGEGGAWGMALLSAYAICGDGLPLGDWLQNKVFAGMNIHTLSPTLDGVDGFNDYIKRYSDGLAAEKALEGVM